MSAKKPAPRKLAIKISLKNPKILLKNVKNEYIADDLRTFISLLFINIF